MQKYQVNFGVIYGTKQYSIMKIQNDWKMGRKTGKYEKASKY